MNGCRTDVKPRSYLWTRAVGPEIISALLWVVEEFKRVAVEHTDHVTRELASHGGASKTRE